MGINKRIRTAFTIKSYSEELTESVVLGLVERDREWQAYTTAEAARKQQLIDSADSLQPVFLRTEFVGNSPSLPGQYLVMDLATKSSIHATLIKAADGSFKVCSLGECTPVAFDLFNFKSYRWFRFSQLSSEDLELVKKLPLS